MWFLKNLYWLLDSHFFGINQKTIAKHKFKNAQELLLLPISQQTADSWNDWHWGPFNVCLRFCVVATVWPAFASASIWLQASSWAVELAIRSAALYSRWCSSVSSSSCSMAASISASVKEVSSLTPKRFSLTRWALEPYWKENYQLNCQNYKNKDLTCSTDQQRAVSQW